MDETLLRRLSEASYIFHDASIEDPHAALAEALGVPRLDAKMLWFRFQFANRRSWQGKELLRYQAERRYLFSKIRELDPRLDMRQLAEDMHVEVTRRVTERLESI